MSKRARNLAITAAAPLITLFLAWNFLAPDRPTRDTSKPIPEVTPQSAGQVARVSEPATIDAAQRLYSIGTYRLNGLSPTTPPGAELEIWVSWSPKVSKQLKLQKLIPRVTLESIEPGPTPEAPSIATLRLPVRALPDMIWGELFGDLAVATRPAD